MKVVHKTVLLLSAITFVVMALFLSRPSVPPDRRTNTHFKVITSPNDVERILSDLPTLWKVMEKDDARRASFLKAMVPLTSMSTVDARNGIVLYLSKKAESARDMSYEEKILPLNRLLFNVSSHDTTPGMVFAGYAYRPMGEGWVNRLWPLEMDDKGRLRLPSKNLACFGPSYSCLAEFDFLALHFKRRAGIHIAP